MRFHLLILDLTAQAIVLFRKFSPVPISLRISPTFSSINFSVSGFMWRSLIHLDLSFLQGDKNGSIHILLHDNYQLSQHHLLKMLSFFYLRSGTLLEVELIPAQSKSSFQTVTCTLHGGHSGKALLLWGFKRSQCYTKNFSPVPISSRLFPTFSSISFSVSGFM